MAVGGGANALEPSTPRLPRSIRYRAIVRTQPRPLRIHVLRIDLGDRTMECVVSAGKDPDGAGPAEAVLTAPDALADEVGAVAAINTVAWSMFPDLATGKAPGHLAGLPAGMHGWVAGPDAMHSPPEPGFWSAWRTRDGEWGIGEASSAFPDAALPRVRWAVSGFGGILRAGKVLVAPSDVRHPRTALGFDARRRTMVWLVVDGRQEGYSEGVSEEELAHLMREQGCADAINLDGGGSTSMWVRDAKGTLQLMNRPSDKTGPRPVPAMLAIRRVDERNAPARPGEDKAK